MNLNKKVIKLGNSIAFNKETILMYGLGFISFFSFFIVVISSAKSSVNSLKDYISNVTSSSYTPLFILTFIGFIFYFIICLNENFTFIFNSRCLKVRSYLLDNTVEYNYTSIEKVEISGNTNSIYIHPQRIKVILVYKEADNIKQIAYTVYNLSKKEWDRFTKTLTILNIKYMKLS